MSDCRRRGSVLRLIGCVAAGIAMPVSAARGQTVWLVRAGAPAGGDGQSWPTAFRDLQEALSAAQAQDQVWVATGTYKPDRNTLDRTTSFQLRSTVLVYGGFSGKESSLAERAGLFDETILTGDLLGNDDDGPLLGNASRADNSLHVVNGSGVNAGAVLDGFTIQAGNAENFNSTVEAADRGGGMYVSNGAPMVRNCRFQRNHAVEGAGLYNRTNHPQLSQCVFRENWAARTGGAIHSFQGSVTIADCEFGDNTAFSPNGVPAGTAYGNGGGVYGQTSTLVVTNCLFTGNAALGWGLNPPVNSPYYGWGGAMVISGGSATISNCQFLANTAEAYAAGIQMLNGAVSVVTDCVFEGNRNLVTNWWHGGGAAMNSWDADLTVRDCVLRDNETDHGGAIHVHGHGASYLFEKCAFINNRAPHDRGGAAYISDGGDYTFRNCLFHGNSAFNGGAVYCHYDGIEHSTVRIESSTFTMNDSAAFGSAGAYHAGDASTISNSIFWGNTAGGAGEGGQQIAGPGPFTFSFNCVQNWSESFGGQGNHGDDPLFTNLAGGELHLLLGSRSLDAGDPSFIPGQGAVDLEGVRRVQNCRVDQGCYESALFSDCDENLAPDGCEPISDCNSNGRFDACEEGSYIDCNLNGSSDLCDLFDGTSLDLNHTDTPDECDGPMIVQAQGLQGQTRPHTGYIDPRAESSDGTAFDRGIDRLDILFNKPVFHLGGGTIGPDSFEVSQSRPEAPPAVIAVAPGQNPLIRIQLSRPITVRQWTTVRAMVQDESGVANLDLGNLGSENEFDRVDIAFLPDDVNNDGRVNPIDLLRFKQYANGIAQPAMGVPADYVDIDRNGVFNPLDLLAFKRLLLGVSPATQPWLGAQLPARP